MVALDREPRDFRPETLFAGRVLTGRASPTTGGTRSVSWRWSRRCLLQSCGRSRRRRRGAGTGPTATVRGARRSLCNESRVLSRRRPVSFCCGCVSDSSGAADRVLEMREMPQARLALGKSPRPARKLSIRGRVAQSQWNQKRRKNCENNENSTKMGSGASAGECAAAVAGECVFGSLFSDMAMNPAPPLLWPCLLSMVTAWQPVTNRLWQPRPSKGASEAAEGWRGCPQRIDTEGALRRRRALSRISPPTQNGSESMTVRQPRRQILRMLKTREQIRHKAAGAPWPWSDDDVLNRHKFMNVKREHDRTTAWLRANWTAGACHADAATVLFNCGVFRVFGTVAFAEQTGWTADLSAWDPREPSNAARWKPAPASRAPTTGSVSTRKRQGRRRGRYRSTSTRRHCRR